MNRQNSDEDEDKDDYDDLINQQSELPSSRRHHSNASYHNQSIESSHNQSNQQYDLKYNTSRSRPQTRHQFM